MTARTIEEATRYISGGKLPTAIIFNEYPDLTITGFFTPQEKVTVVSSWDRVLEMLQKSHGDKAKVAVYSSSEIQYC